MRGPKVLFHAKSRRIDWIKHRGKGGKDGKYQGILRGSDHLEGEEKERRERGNSSFNG